MATCFFTKGVEVLLTSAATPTGIQHWDGNTSVKGAIMLSTYSTVANKSNVHVFRSDTSTSEVGGQTAQTLASLVLSRVTASSKVFLKCTSTLVFSNVTTNANVGGLCVFYDSGAAGTSPLLTYLDFTAQITSTNGQPITVTFNTDGVASILASAT